MGTEVTQVLQGRFRTIDDPTVLRGYILGVTRLDVPAVCCSILRPQLKRHRTCVEDGLVLAVICSRALVARFGWAEKEVRLVKVNFTFETFEGQDEVT